jgi:hypothetical protein
VSVLTLTLISATTNLSKLSQESAVGALTRYGLCERGIPFQIVAGAKYLTLPQNVQIGSQVHRTLYRMGIRGFFPRVQRSNVGDIRKEEQSYMCTSVPPHDFMSCAWKTLRLPFVNKLKYRGKS